MYPGVDISLYAFVAGKLRQKFEAIFTFRIIRVCARGWSHVSIPGSEMDVSTAAKSARFADWKHISNPLSVSKNGGIPGLTTVRRITLAIYPTT